MKTNIPKFPYEFVINDTTEMIKEICKKADVRVKIGSHQDGDKYTKGMYVHGEDLLKLKEWFKTTGQLAEADWTQESYDLYLSKSTHELPKFFITPEREDIIFIEKDRANGWLFDSEIFEEGYSCRFAEIKDFTARNIALYLDEKDTSSKHRTLLGIFNKVIPNKRLCDTLMVEILNRGGLGELK